MNRIESNLYQSYMTLKEPLTSEEIESLPKLKNLTQVQINLKTFTDLSNLSDMLKKFNNNLEIIFNIDDNNQNIFNEYALANEEFLKTFPNLKACKNIHNFDITTYLENEKRLYDIVRPAQDFSPFEKYLYVYNIVKNYKVYAESPEDKSQSRSLYALLDSDYMVCFGYTNLLCDLLNKLNIPACQISATIFGGVQTKEELQSFEVDNPIGKMGFHSRAMVNLVDSKYNINGLFFTDPTWDNRKENDTYNYALLTPDEYNKSHNYNYLETNSLELFFVHNEQEFDERFAFLSTQIINSDNFIFHDVNPWQYLIHDLLNYIHKLDRDFYNHLKKRYVNLEATDKEKVIATYKECYSSLRKYIISKVNKPIDYQTLKEGITFIYKQTYVASDEEIEKMVEQTMQQNAERQELVFPNRKIIDQNDNITDLDYMPNKFTK